MPVVFLVSEHGMNDVVEKFRTGERSSFHFYLLMPGTK